MSLDDDRDQSDAICNLWIPMILGKYHIDEHRFSVHISSENVYYTIFCTFDGPIHGQLYDRRSSKQYFMIYFMLRGVDAVFDICHSMHIGFCLEIRMNESTTTWMYWRW